MRAPAGSPSSSGTLPPSAGFRVTLTPMDTSNPYTLRVREVARLFSVHPDTVTRWCDEGKLPCWRTPGGHRRFREQDVRELLQPEAVR